MFQNFQYKLLALVLAILFWVLIISLESNFYPFPQAVPIKAFNLDPSLALTQDLGEVQLTLKTAQENLAHINQEAFEVYVDLTNLEAGEHRISISVTSKNPEIQVVKTEPTQITLTLEEIATKIVPLTLEIKGKPAPNYQVGTPELTVTELSVSGAKSLLNQIGEIKAVVRLTGAETTDQVKKAFFEIPDLTDSVIQNLTFEPTETQVYLPLTQLVQTKNVGIRVNVFPSQFVDAFIKKIETEPSTVVITGKNKDLVRVDYLETEEVNLTEKAADSPFQTQVNLILPENISLSKPEDRSVQVTVYLEANIEVVETETADETSDEETALEE